MKKAEDRCTGHCCQKLTIPFSPEKLREAYDAWLRSQNGYPIHMNHTEDNQKIYSDIHLIAPMLEHLGEFEVSPVKQVNKLIRIGKPTKGHYYRCKNFDTKKKICTIYEIRPHMCRSYPNGHPCNYSGCTWSTHKAKKETPKQTRERRKKLKAEAASASDQGGA